MSSCWHSCWHSCVHNVLNPHRPQPQLVERFGAARDEWIREDLDGWLAPNRIYDGVADALRSLKGREDVYIVTTKQARRLAPLTHCACEDRAAISSEQVLIESAAGFSVFKRGVPPLSLLLPCSESRARVSNGVAVLSHSTG